MRVLVACETSGVVRDAFRARGHESWSCDLLPAEDAGINHLVEDAITAIDLIRPDILIAHPPCTYLCNSGVRWLSERPERWMWLEQACGFFRALMTAPVERIAIENPVMHGYARTIIGRGPDQTIQPWQFGDDASKRTGLWLKGLPPLHPTASVEPRIVQGKRRWANQTDSGQNMLPPSDDRWKQRSKTYKGIAAAMADQWGNADVQLEL